MNKSYISDSFSLDEVATHAKKKRHLQKYIRTYTAKVEEGLVVTAHPVKFLKYTRYCSASEHIQMSFKCEVNWVQDIIIQLHMSRATFYLRLLEEPQQLLIVYKDPGCNDEKKHHVNLVKWRRELLKNNPWLVFLCFLDYWKTEIWKLAYWAG